MIELTDDFKKQFRIVQIIGFLMLIAVPVILLIVVKFVKFPIYQTGGESDIMLYILLILSMIQPTITPLIEKYHISNFKNKPIQSSTSVFSNSIGSYSPLFIQFMKGTPLGLYINVSIIRNAFIESIYMYGFVTFMITGDITKMLYFYPIGIAWSIVYFPTKSRCEKFLEKVSSHEPV